MDRDRYRFLRFTGSQCQGSTLHFIIAISNQSRYIACRKIDADVGVHFPGHGDGKRGYLFVLGINRHIADINFRKIVIENRTNPGISENLNATCVTQFE